MEVYSQGNLGPPNARDFGDVEEDIYDPNELDAKPIMAQLPTPKDLALLETLKDPLSLVRTTQ